MKRLVPLAATLALGGCGLLPPADAAPPAPAPAPIPTPSPATAGLGTAASADLPDPCTLLSEDEVPELTGRPITLIDRDDAGPDATTRYCQWQQEGGQLAVFLSRTSDPDFRTASENGEMIDGVGEASYAADGHLYVLSEGKQLDVYAHGDDEKRNLHVSTEVAQTLIPRI